MFHASDLKFSLFIRAAGTKPSTERAKERVHTSRLGKGNPSGFLRTRPRIFLEARSMSRVSCYSVHRLIVISDNHLSLFARVGIAAPDFGRLFLESNRGLGTFEGTKAPMAIERPPIAGRPF
jgi:hypothetical protein